MQSNSTETVWKVNKREEHIMHTVVYWNCENIRRKLVYAPHTPCRSIWSCAASKARAQRHTSPSSSSIVATNGYRRLFSIPCSWLPQRCTRSTVHRNAIQCIIQYIHAARWAAISFPGGPASALWQIARNWNEWCLSLLPCFISHAVNGNSSYSCCELSRARRYRACSRTHGRYAWVVQPYLERSIRHFCEMTKWKQFSVMIMWRKCVSICDRDRRSTVPCGTTVPFQHKRATSEVYLSSPL